MLWFDCFTALGAVPTGITKTCLSDDDVLGATVVAITVDVDDNDEEEMLEFVELGMTIPFLVQMTLGFKTGTGLMLVRDEEMSLDDLSVRPLDFGFEDFAELARTCCLLDSYKIRKENKLISTIASKK